MVTTIDITARSGAEHLVDQLYPAAAEPGPRPYDPDVLLSRIRTGPWLDAQQFPPLAWAVPGLIPEGFGLLTGPPKLGKSWFVLGVGLAVACGGRALGRIDVEQRPVLYLALEDGDRRMQSRVQTLQLGEPTPAGWGYLTTATTAEVRPIIRAWLDRYQTGVVMLDTLGRVMPPAGAGESAYQRDYAMGAALKELTDAHPGSTLIVVHHTRKQAGADWMDSTSGTQGLNGSADWTLSLERGRGEGEAVIRVSGRDVPEGEYAATMTDGCWTLDGASLVEAAAAARERVATTGVGDVMAQVIDYVSRHPEGSRPAEVAIALGLDATHVRVYLRRALDAGRVDSPSRGLYTPSVTSVTTVTLPEEPTTPAPREVTLITPTPSTVTSVDSRLTRGDSPQVTEVTQVTPLCTDCGQPMVFDDGTGTHPTCGGDHGEA